jgi:SAM-dependent methyltransferase
LTHKVWSYAGFGAGQTIVDLGSGPGFTSVELADVVGESGRVIAVDSSSTANDYLRKMVVNRGVGNTEIITADVNEFDPSPWRPDGLFARWLFCFLERPEAVVARLASGLRAGATVAVIDYWNYLAIRTEPGNPLFTKVFRAVYDSFADAGGSLEVAGRLPAILDAAGFTVMHLEALSQVGLPGSCVWEWVAEFQKLYLPVLVRKGYLTEAESETYEAWWREQERSRRAVLFAPPLLGVIAVKD